MLAVLYPSTYFSNTFSDFTHFYKQTSGTQPPKVSINYLIQPSMWMSDNPKFEVEITSWRRDVHGLFDFHGTDNQYNITKHQISDHCQIFLNSKTNSAYLNSNKREAPKYCDYVCQVERSNIEGDHRFWIKWNPPSNLSKNQYEIPRYPCIVLKDFKVKKDKEEDFEGYSLEVGQVVKFGLISFLIRELNDERTLNKVQQLFKANHCLRNPYSLSKDSISTNSQESQADKLKKNGDVEYEMEDSFTRAKKRTIKKDNKVKTRKKGEQKSKNKNREDSESENSSEMIEEERSCFFSQEVNHLQEQQNQLDLKKETVKEECKFCLMEEENSENDPFISPCKCKGSVQRVHMMCFMEWIASKLSISQKNQAKTFRLQKNRCEVCKIPYPQFIECGSKVINLIEIKRPLKPYLLLQKVQKIGTFQSTFVLISGEENKVITVGRADDNDIKLNDISVSRHHSQFFYRNGRFYIKDLKSKFGTLVKFEKDRLFDFYPAKIQIGRVFYKISPLFGNVEESSSSFEEEEE